MLSTFVGSVDFNSAVVLVAFFGMITIIGAVLFTNRQSRLAVSNEFELAKIKQRDAHNEILFRQETDRGFKFKQLETGLITSHKRDNEE